MAQEHVRRLRRCPDAEIAALCDIRQEALDNTVKRWEDLDKVPQFDDFRKMIDAVDLDGVAIVTPHTVHYEQIIACLDHGLNVISEKPMVCTVKHAHNVLDKIEQTGKVFVLAYQRHYEPEFLYVRDMIARGDIGRVEFVQGLQCQDWLRSQVGQWRQDPALSGGGQLNDSGSHLLAVLLFCSGLGVERVSAFIDNMGTRVDIDSAMTLEFVGGAKGNISVVGSSPTWHEDLTIWGEEGVCFMRDNKLQICDGKGKRFRPRADQLPEGTDPDANFVEAILGRAEVGSQAVWGLRVIELTEAAWKSAASGHVETVDRSGR
jgi:predicted dehydrogenase